MKSINSIGLASLKFQLMVFLLAVPWFIKCNGNFYYKNVTKKSLINSYTNYSEGYFRPEFVFDTSELEVTKISFPECDCEKAKEILETVIESNFEIMPNAEIKRIIEKKIKYERCKDECPFFYLDCLYYISGIEMYSGNRDAAFEKINSGFDFIKRLKSEKNLYYSDEDKYYTLLGEYYLETGWQSRSKENYIKSKNILEENYKTELANNNVDSNKIRALEYRMIINRINLTNISCSQDTLLASDTFFDESILKEFDSIISTLDVLVKANNDAKYLRVFAYTQLYKTSALIEKYKADKSKKKYLDSAIETLDRVKPTIKQFNRLKLMTMHYEASIDNILEKHEDVFEKIRQIVVYNDKPLKEEYFQHAGELLEIGISSLPESEKEILSPLFNIHKKYLEKIKTNNEDLFTEAESLSREILSKRNSVNELEQSIVQKEEKLISVEKRNIILANKFLFIALFSLILLIVAIIAAGLSFKMKKQNITIKKKENFLGLLHEHSKKLGALVAEFKDENSFLEKTVAETFLIAKNQMKFDSLAIGIVEKGKGGLNLFAKEIRGDTIETPDKPAFYGFDETNRLPIYCFSKQKTILEGDYMVNFRNYVEELPETKLGVHSSSIIYAPIGDNFGIITAQSQEKNIYTEEHLKILETLGENVAVAYGNVLALSYFKREKDHVQTLQRETSHRIKNHLQALVSNINLQLLREEINNNEIAKNALFKVKNRTEAVLVIHQMVHQKWQEEKQKYISLQTYFTRLRDVLFFQSFGYNDSQVEFELELEILPEINVEIVKDLASVIVELALNVFEHAYQGYEEHWIKFVAKVEENKLFFIIADKGKGWSFEGASKSGSFGLKLAKIIIEERWKGAIYRSFFDEEKKEGTQFKIQIPFHSNLLK